MGGFCGFYSLDPEDFLYSSSESVVSSSQLWKIYPPIWLFSGSGFGLLFAALGNLWQELAMSLVERLLCWASRFSEFIFLSLYEKLV